jgi:hypothetical protein
MSAAVPAALALGASSASAQWSAQQSPQQGQQQRGQQRGQQQRYPAQQQSRYGPQQLFTWQGRVDREMRIQMDGGRTSVMQMGSNERGSGRVRAVSRVPNQPGFVTVQQMQGRGRVDVVQQPDSRNGYTTIIRVRDPASGAADYRVAAYWQPTGYSGAYGDGSRYDNSRQRGDADDDWHDNSRGNGHDNGRHNGHH